MNESKPEEHTIHEIEAIVANKFSIEKIPYRGILQFKRVISVFNNLDGLQGKRILDLGCGSTLTKDKSIFSSADSQRDYEPWLCRLLEEAGAHSVGIDIHNLSNESFEHYQGDLSKEAVFDFMPDESIDLINSCSLLGNCPSPLLLAREDFDKQKTEDMHLMQAWRLLKERGVYLYDILYVYRKENGIPVKYEHIKDLKK